MTRHLQSSLYVLVLLGLASCAATHVASSDGTSTLPTLTAAAGNAATTAMPAHESLTPPIFATDGWLATASSGSQAAAAPAAYDEHLRGAGPASDGSRGLGDRDLDRDLPAVQDRSRDHQPWEFTLGGSGVSDKHWNAVNAGVNASAGYYFTDVIELTARQSASWVDTGPGSGDKFAFGTTVAIDFHIPLDIFQPFVGANIGYLYGNGINDTWAAGPEAGVKIYIKSDVFIVVFGEWEVAWHENQTLGQALDDGAWFYSVGLGARF
jgi:hypothetical protein